MFSNVYLKNIEGITEEKLNFIAKSRNKETLNTALETKDGIYINRQLAIIGPNASGKTSTLKAISNMCAFIILPVFLNQLLSNFKEKDNIKDLKQMIYQMSNVKKNVNSINELSIFSIELYVENELDETTTGYYEYTIKFSGDLLEEGIDEEILTFRNKYTSRKKIEVSNKKNIKNSQVGYLYTFLNNFEESNENLKYIKVFGDQIIQNMDSSFFDVEESLYLVNKFLKEKTDISKKIINLVDSEIVDIVEIKKNRIDSNMSCKFKFMTKSGNFLQYEQLSKGTQKILFVISKVLDSTSKNKIILIDEIESNINKDLIDIIFKTFFSKQSSSQIIFTSNYPTIIPDNFKYDQIYMLKRIDGKTTAERLIDFRDQDGKKIRQDVSFSRAYLSGRLDNNKEKKNNENRINNFLDCL